MSPLLFLFGANVSIISEWRETIKVEELMTANSYWGVQFREAEHGQAHFNLYFEREADIPAKQ